MYIRWSNVHNGNSMIKNVYQIQAQILKPERYFEHDHIKVIQICSLLLLYLKHFFHCIVIFLSYCVINAKILHDKIELCYISVIETELWMVEIRLFFSMRTNIVSLSKLLIWSTTCKAKALRDYHFFYHM